MTIRIVQLGSDRAPDEGTRIGTVRRPPRGVAKHDFARLDFYDVWFPVLAPTAAALKAAIPIRTGKQVLTFVVAEKPAFAGVDPYNFYVDRKSSDNVKPVA